MLFNSYEFALLFLPLFMVGYCIIRYVLNKKQVSVEALSYYCLAGSLFFYALFGLRNFMVLFFSILFNLIVLMLLERRDKRNGADILLFIGILVNCLLLLFYKH